MKINLQIEKLVRQSICYSSNLCVFPGDLNLGSKMILNHNTLHLYKRTEKWFYFIVQAFFYKVKYQLVTYESILN